MTIKKGLLITAGNVLTAMGIGLFYLPNKIVNGGVSGLSTILYHTLGIPPGLSFALINVILFVVCAVVLGKQIVLGSLYGVIVLTVSVQLFSYCRPVTDSLILSVVFGGVLYGAGLGLALMEGASTGGTDLLGRLLQYKFPRIPIGKLLLCIDGSIILASFLLFQAAELALYGIMALVISTLFIDFIIHKRNESKLAFVILEQGEKIADMLVSTSPRGVTVIEGKGAYNGGQKYMLLCAMKEREQLEFEKKVLSVDEGAFIIFSQSQQVVGNGFFVYR